MPFTVSAFGQSDVSGPRAAPPPAAAVVVETPAGPVVVG
jgi:hypothetical protein